MTNLVILVGRIARDPETRTTQGGTNITSISVVTDRPARKDGKTYKDENGYTVKDSEFHRVAEIARGIERAARGDRSHLQQLVREVPSRDAPLACRAFPALGPAGFAGTQYGLVPPDPACRPPDCRFSRIPGRALAQNDRSVRP